MMTENIYSVSEINNFLKNIIEAEPELRNVQVIGEVSNFKRYPSGHCYFTLKDAGAVLKCVMFRYKAASLRFEPANGETVVAIGRIAVYERDGVYQLYTDVLLQQGVGDLMQAYNKLKQKLERSGLFAAERKQPLPVNPHTVGIITSQAGAAVRDIITVARRRNSGIKLLLYPVKVQGAGAAAEIAQAVEFFNRHRLAEVLIVGRGGGSVEDLWAFNEERTVCAVAASQIPVVSAVGHETDYTLCDFAADMRAATPSQAAELAVADVEGYRRRVQHLLQRAQGLVSAQLAQYEQRLQVLCSSWALRDSERLFAKQLQRTDAAVQRLREAMASHEQRRQHAFALVAARLDSLSPLAVLARGYTVTQRDDYTLLQSTQQVKWGDELITTLADGTVRSVVQQVEGREKWQ